MHEIGEAERRRIKEEARAEVREEIRLEALEARVAEFEDKLESMAHALVDQVTERWDDKLGVLRGDLKEWLQGEMVTRSELAGAVRKEHERIEIERQTRTRSTARFWLAVILGGISIASAAFTVVFWLTQTVRGH